MTRKVDILNQIIYTPTGSMKNLKSMEDKCVQMVLTDVPYDFTNDEEQEWHEQFKRLCFGTIIVFSPPENQWILPANQYLFWEKPISTKNTSKRYSRFVEMMFVYEMEYHQWITGRHWSQYTNVFKDLVDNSSLHPYRKPPSLIERLILNHTKESDIILDPFGGSFVVAETAQLLGRQFITMEKEKKYIEDISNRTDLYRVYEDSD